MSDATHSTAVRKETRELPPFRPHRFLLGPHAQTIAGAYLPGARFTSAAKQHRLPLADGDQLVLHDEAAATWRNGGRIALLVHGLGGSHRSIYIARTAGKLVDRGLRVVRMDLRGSGAGWDLAVKPGHAGCSDDVAAVVRWLEQQYPDSPVSIIGSSMGGNIALKLAAEVGAQPLGRLEAVLAVGPPIDCAACADFMEQPENRIYTRSYLRALMAQVRRRRRSLANWAALSPSPAPRTIREFDERFTAPLSGFDSVEQYYATSSSKFRLGEIRLPAMVIASADDPVVPASVFEDLSPSTAVEVHITDAGGHIGYIAEPGVDPDRRWLDWRAVDWILEQGL